MSTIEELAALPVGQDQIDRAHAYCCEDPDLLARVAEFLSHGVTRGQMVTFLEELRPANKALLRKRQALGFCRSVGIENPSNIELLLAQRNAILHEELSEVRKKFYEERRGWRQHCDSYHRWND
jgi:hypothetical protein